MKNVICIAIWFLLINPVLASEPGIFNLSARLSVGDEYTCILESDSVKCWDRDGKNLSFPSSGYEKNPQMVSTAGSVICILGKQELGIWSRDGNRKILRLKNPRFVSAGRESVCALDDEGAKCWDHQGNILYAPPLKNPRQIQAGTHSCALDDEGVKCWFYRGNSYRTFYFEYQPISISTAGSTACVMLDPEGKDYVMVHSKCWNFYYQTTNQFALAGAPNSNCEPGPTHPYGCPVTKYLDKPEYSDTSQAASGGILQVTVKRAVGADGGAEICELYLEQVICWSPFVKQHEFYAGGSPRFLSQGTAGICVLDNQGLRCERYKNLPKYPQLALKNLLSHWTQNLGEVSSPPRQKYYFEVQKFYDNSLKDAFETEKRAWNIHLDLMAPAIESSESAVFAGIIPNYRSFQRLMRQDHVANPTYFQKYTILDWQVFLKHIQAALSVAVDFLNPDQKAQIGILVRVVGIAFQDPTQANLKSVLTEIEAQRPILDVLKQSKKTEFLVSVIDLAASKLRKQVY